MTPTVTVPFNQKLINKPQDNLPKEFINLMVLERRRYATVTRAAVRPMVHKAMGEVMVNRFDGGAFVGSGIANDLGGDTI